ncbi:unnamed protein product [Meloidogyne enterolobii]|uniref:Uncharacterized protein n=1 Tax=Meloidogyne enterolobii TaxID=390850 RepID=A0ACB1AY43_MELEN
MARAILSEDARANAPSASAMSKKYRVSKRKAEALGDIDLNSINPLQIIIPQYLQEYVILNENTNIAGQQRKVIVLATPGTLNLLDVYRLPFSTGNFRISGTEPISEPKNHRFFGSVRSRTDNPSQYPSMERL